MDNGGDSSERKATMPGAQSVTAIPVTSNLSGTGPVPPPLSSSHGVPSTAPVGGFGGPPHSTPSSASKPLPPPSSTSPHINKPTTTSSTSPSATNRPLPSPRNLTSASQASEEGYAQVLSSVCSKGVFVTSLSSFYQYWVQTLKTCGSSVAAVVMWM